MQKSEPPPSGKSSHFMVGKNQNGNWVVQDSTGLCGGLFVDRREALKFVAFENADRPVIVVPGTLELNMNLGPHTGQRPALRRAASRGLRSRGDNRQLRPSLQSIQRRLARMSVVLHQILRSHIGLDRPLSHRGRRRGRLERLM